MDFDEINQVSMSELAVSLCPSPPCIDATYSRFSHACFLPTVCRRMTPSFLMLPTELGGFCQWAQHHLFDTLGDDSEVCIPAVTFPDVIITDKNGGQHINANKIQSAPSWNLLLVILCD